MAEQTITSPLILIFFCKESPIDGYAARIANNSFGHTPQKHEEEDVKDDNQNNIRCGFEAKQELNKKDKIIESDE